MPSKSKLLIPVLGFAALSSSASGAALSVRLLSSMPSPQPVGTVIGLFPRVENAAAGMQVFRYSVSVDGGPLHVVRDFSQQKEFVWRPQLYEHDATVHVTVRNNVTKETAEAELPFRIVSRIKGSQPVVTPTSNPLIALFSAPTCPEGRRFRVAFQRQGDMDDTRDKALSHTALENCRGSRSGNA